ncbi:hypothetical protein, partial [Staphylococcus capitis]|uniref:hypothetical protein n=1 Tax=Staphylococcus capitis TaxID=29388 RepID=UPI0030BF510F
IKKPVNEFVKTHLLAISLGFMSQTLNALTSVNVFLNLVKNYLVTLNALTLVNVILKFSY